MDSKSDNLFTRKPKGDVILLIFKAIFLSLTLILGAIVIHLEHNINASPPSSESSNPFDSSLQPSSNPIIYTNSYVFTVALVRATEQLQDAIALTLSSYSNADVDAELAWRNCSGWMLNGWGEIQDAAEHLMMNPFMERPNEEQRAEMTSQIIATEGFIDSCIADLEMVESSAAVEVRAKLLLAKVYLRGRGDFLTSYYDEIWNRVTVGGWGIVLENMFYIIFCAVQLFLVLYMFQKWSRFRST